MSMLYFRNMHTLWNDKNEFINSASRCLSLSPALTITNENTLRSSFIDELIYNAVFTNDDELKKEYIILIHTLSNLLKSPPSSIKPLYMAFGTGSVKGFTTAALNLRVLTYDSARAVFRLMNKYAIGGVIFELARSEMEYTDQKPQEYSACILAAAIKENFNGPVFLQGDHYQISKNHFAENPDAEMDRIKSLIRESIDAGFLNIDIDASTLVDLSKSSILKQQKLNSEITAKLTEFIRSIEPSRGQVSVGGEIGHIGDKNSTVDDFKAFMTHYLLLQPENGLSKISIQTGSTHGGTILPDGKMKDVKIDFSILKEIGDLARQQYSLGGAVQHGASTLPLQLFSEFVKNQTLEVHLATGIQNLFFDSCPNDIINEMYTWLYESYSDKRENGWNDEQFLYKMRKFTFGPFKQVVWDMDTSEKELYLTSLSSYLEKIFLSFNLRDSNSVIKKFI